MKIQELFEANDNAIHFDSYDEFKNFFVMKAKDDNIYHFEDVSGQDGDEYDILVKLYSFDDHGDARVSVDWNIVAFGSGDYDNDINFWVREGRPEIDPKYDRYIEDKIIDDQSYRQ